MGGLLIPLKKTFVIGLLFWTTWSYGADGALCLIFDQAKTCPLSDVQEFQQTIQVAVVSQLSGTGTNFHSEDSVSNVGLGLSASINEEFAYYALPLSYNFTDMFRFGVLVPYISGEDGKEGIGHVLAKFSLFHGGRALGASLGLGAFVPSGSPEVSPPKEQPDPHFDLMLRLSFGRTRLFWAASHTLRLPDSTGLDLGDTSTAFLGWDSAYEGNLNYYIGVFTAQTEEDTLDGYAMKNQISIVDVSGGIIFPGINFRLGATGPLYTESTVIGAGDRKSSFDVGFKFEI